MRRDKSMKKYSVGSHLFMQWVERGVEKIKFYPWDFKGREAMDEDEARFDARGIETIIPLPSSSALDNVSTLIEDGKLILVQ